MDSNLSSRIKQFLIRSFKATSHRCNNLDPIRNFIFRRNFCNMNPEEQRGQFYLFNRSNPIVKLKNNWSFLMPPRTTAEFFVAIKLPVESNCKTNWRSLFDSEDLKNRLRSSLRSGEKERLLRGFLCLRILSKFRKTHNISTSKG